MLDLTLTESPLVPITGGAEKPVSRTIEGEVREIFPASSPRDGSYTFKQRRKITVAANHW